MNTDFFTFDNWRSFLRERFQYLKATKPQFSARYFARQAGIRSPSYFQLVVTGQRTLSVDYAERFAAGLSLDQVETKCLVTCVALETCLDRRRREQLTRQLETLRRRSERTRKMLPNHVRVLADPVNLKLYLLAQSQRFDLSPRWLRREMPETETDASLGERVALLIDSGLWIQQGRRMQTMAPTVHTGNQLDGSDLRKMHENLLDAARTALSTQPSEQRVVGSRTFLFDRAKIARVQEKIDAFKQEMEAEFESLEGTSVYQLHLSFFELEPKA